MAKYDEVIIFFENEDGEEISVAGEITNYTDDKLVLRDQNGAYHVVGRDTLIDVDHKFYADRTEEYRH